MAHLVVFWHVGEFAHGPGEMCAGLEEQVRTLENAEVLGLQVRERPELAA